MVGTEQKVLVLSPQKILVKKKHWVFLGNWLSIVVCSKTCMKDALNNQARFRSDFFFVFGALPSLPKSCFFGAAFCWLMPTLTHKRSCQGQKEMGDTLSGKLWTKSNCRNCIVWTEKIKSIKKLFMRLFVSVLLLSWIMSFPGLPFYCITSSAAASWGEGIYLQICQKQESKEEQSDFPIPLNTFNNKLLGSI